MLSPALGEASGVGSLGCQGQKGTKLQCLWGHEIYDGDVSTPKLQESRAALAQPSFAPLCPALGLFQFEHQARGIAAWKPGEVAPLRYAGLKTSSNPTRFHL